MLNIPKNASAILNIETPSYFTVISPLGSGYGFEQTTIYGLERCVSVVKTEDYDLNEFKYEISFMHLNEPCHIPDDYALLKIALVGNLSILAVFDSLRSPGIERLKLFFRNESDILKVKMLQSV